MCVLEKWQRIKVLSTSYVTRIRLTLISSKPSNTAQILKGSISKIEKSEAKMLYFNDKKHISQNGSFLVSCVCYILNVFVISVIVVIGMLYALLLGLQGFAFAFF